MRILFLTHYFPPEVNAPASRTFEHARVWAKAGHEVTVVTCAPNHPHGKVYPGYRNALWGRETIEGVNVIRLWTFVSANEGFARRSLNYLSYLVAATLAAPFLPRADIVVSTSPQFFCGLAGWPVSRVRRAPWVLEIRDLWPESIVTVGAMKKGLLTRALEGLARWAYRAADRLIVVTDAFKTQIAAGGVDASKIVVLKNGVDFAQFPAEVDRSKAKGALGLDGKFVAAYVGTHGMAHRLDTVLEAAALLAHRRDIVFLLVGGGAERARLLALRDERKLDNVVMLEQQPKSAMPQIIGATDVSLVLLKKDDVFRTVLPSKMFESMAMRRPIVLGVEGEALELLQAAGAGLPIEPENAQQLADAVTRLADDCALCAQLGESGRAHALAHYDRVKLAARYIDTLQDVIDRRA